MIYYILSVRSQSYRFEGKKCIGQGSVVTRLVRLDKNEWISMAGVPRPESQLKNRYFQNLKIRKSERKPSEIQFYDDFWKNVSRAWKARDSTHVQKRFQ